MDLDPPTSRDVRDGCMHLALREPHPELAVLVCFAQHSRPSGAQVTHGLLNGAEIIAGRVGSVPFRPVALFENKST